MKPRNIGRRVFGGFVRVFRADLLGILTLVLLPVSLRAQSTPVATIFPDGLTFFDQLLGTNSPGQLVYIFNSGSATLNITSISVTGPFTQGSACATIASLDSCLVNVSYKPTAVGAQTGTLTIVDNATNSPQQISLSGNGIDSGAVLNPPTLSFNPQVPGTTSGTMSANLFNTSTGTLTISSIAASGDYAVSSTCGSSLAAGGVGCNISVTFTPTATGTRTGMVTITDSGSGSPHTLNLTGTGAASGVSLSPTSLSFPSQNVGTTSSAETFTVTNTGSTSLSLISIVASGDYAQTNTCRVSLAPEASCVVTVTFTPSAAGSRSGRITLNDTDPTNLQTISITGTGTSPTTTVAVSPRTASVTFTQTEQFQASISGVSSSAVTWSVDGITGGNSSVGTISASGLYVPPSAAGAHQVTATSTADTTQSATVPIVVTDYEGVFTQHNDNSRTGQNLNETILTTGNVNSAQFGMLFSYPVDGNIFAQPLYVANVNIPSQGYHNVVYVATENDSVFAFDADGLTATPLWQVSFINPNNGVTTIPSGDIPCTDIYPQYGITSTPVIAPGTNTLYVVARTKEVSGGVTSYVQRLHALDITTGAERPGSPVVIQPVVAGGGIDSNGDGYIYLNGLTANQRAGLVLSDGVVYIAWGSSCDLKPFHGWVVAYDAAKLQQVGVLNTSPNGQEAGIWQGGAAPAVDASGNLFMSTGNGTFDADFGGTERASSILKLAPSSLSVLDYFTPYNAYWLDSTANLDLDSGGVLLLPDQPTEPTHLLLGGGKQGTIYLVNRDDMGEFNSVDNDQIVQMLVHAVGSATGDGGIRGVPGYYQNQVYYAAIGDVAKAFRLYDGVLSPTPISQSGKAESFSYPGATPSISANGRTNGIVWLISPHLTSTSSSLPYVLYAFDATNLGQLLYSSASTPAGASVKFAVPTVANGKVFVGSATELDVFGLLP